MKEKKTIAKKIQALSDAEKIRKMDAACKRILSEKVILARILKNCVPEYKDSDADDIAEKYIEGIPQVSVTPVMQDEKFRIIGMNTEDSSVHEGTVVYDILFYAILPDSGEKIGLIINVEVQNKFNPGYPLVSRGLYYCSRLISSQRGTFFSESDYGETKKVYSIWICLRPPKDRRNTITRYRIIEENVVGDVTEPVRNYDLLSVIMICPSRAETRNYAGILRLLGEIFSSETSEEEKCRILQEEYNIQMTQTLKEELNMGGFGEFYFEELMERGIAQGMAQGMEKGEAKGRDAERIANINSLMRALQCSAQKAMDMLQIPKQEQDQYISKL